MNELCNDDPSELQRLVEAAQAGDKEAFEALYDRYSSRIHNLLRGLARNIEDRNDLTQSTFEKAWKKLPDLRQTSSFKYWLDRIAKNLGKDYQCMKSQERSQQSSLEGDLEKGGVDLKDMDSPEGYIELQEFIQEILTTMPTKWSACLRLQLQGKSYSEIAKILGIKQKTVATYISNALEYFRRERLKQQKGED